MSSWKNVDRIEGRIERHEGHSWLEYRIGSGDTVEILDINVSNTARRQGTGREMVKELLSRLGKDNLLVYAITRWSNTAAQEFYEAIGFRIVGRLHNFYRQREDMKDGKSGFETAVMYGYDV